MTRSQAQFSCTSFVNSKHSTASISQAEDSCDATCTNRGKAAFADSESDLSMICTILMHKIELIWWQIDLRRVDLNVC